MTPDALVLGPLVLEWGRLAFLIGVMVFLTVLSTKNAKLERIGTIAVILGVLAARLGFVFEQREAFASGSWIEIFDLRSGGFSWPWALLALVPFAWLRTPAQLSKLASAAAIAVVTAALPFLFKPTANSITIPNNLQLQTLEGTPSTWGSLKKPALINVWATWCGPCRAEMPLLAEYAKQGANIIFLNAGESAAQIRNYLESEKLEIPVMLDLSGIRNGLRVVGLPSTFVIGADGQILERRMGPLDRGSLRVLLAQVGGKASK